VEEYPMVEAQVDEEAEAEKSWKERWAEWKKKAKETFSKKVLAEVDSEEFDQALEELGNEEELEALEYALAELEEENEVDTEWGWWNKMKEKAGDYWDKTKEKAGEYWDKTKEKSGEYWDKTKEYVNTSKLA